MDDKTTGTLPWLAFTLAFENSARLTNHLRQSASAPYELGLLVKQYIEGERSALEAGLDGLLTRQRLSAITCDDVCRKVDEALEWEQAHADHHLIALDHSAYPALLLDTADAPPLLYAKGHLDALSLPTLAIVGSRKASRQGIDLTYSLARRIAARGVSIVSGLAKGIDAAAHRGALAAKGRTIAIAATDAISVYPRQHKELASNIVSQGGLIVTEYPLGSKTLRWHFPKRNRIISGISLGVLVAEAGLPSGTLTTATHAINQGREVMAIPGSVHNTQARGCHELIKQGATLVDCEQDILDALAWPLMRKLTDRSHASPEHSNSAKKIILERKEQKMGSQASLELFPDNNLIESSVENTSAQTPMDILEVTSQGTSKDTSSQVKHSLGNKMLSETSDKARLNPPNDPAHSRLEHHILAALSVEPATIDNLMAISGCTISQLTTTLGLLEIEGKIMANSGGRYSRC